MVYFEYLNAIQKARLRAFGLIRASAAQTTSGSIFCHA